MDTFTHTSQIEVDIQALNINKGESINKPAIRHLTALSVDINKEDSVYWKADQPCFLTLFNPKGEQIQILSGGELLAGKKVKTEEKGTYYALLHDAPHDETYNKTLPTPFMGTQPALCPNW